MKACLSHCALIFLFFCLCSCAKEQDFPSQNQYPLLKLFSATVDSTGIQVSAGIVTRGKAQVKEYGISYSPTSSPNKELRVKAPAAAEDRFDTIVQKQLIGQTTYEIKAYALVNNKIVYSSPLQVKTLVASQPTITDFSPQEGPSNTEITIYGANFSDDRWKVQAYIGTKGAHVLSSEPDKIVIRVPEGDYFGSYPIRVVVNDLEIKTEKVFKIWGPEITGISKSEAMPGDTVTLFGKHLNIARWGPYVQLNGKYDVAFKVLSASDTKLKLEVPLSKFNFYDTPLPITLQVDEKRAQTKFTFTINSNFDNVNQPSRGFTSNYMPSFAADGKGYFFDYNRVVSYSTVTGVWQEESRFPGTARHSPIWERVGDKAYLIGGTESFRYYGDVWEYDFRTTKWKQLPSLHFAIRNAASFVLDGTLYFRGLENSIGSRALWKYNVLTHQAEVLSSFSGNSTTYSFFIRKGKAYAYSRDDVRVYNQTSDTWTIDSQFNKDKSGRIFTIGDSETFLIATNPSPILYRYHDSTNTWEKEAFWPGCLTNYTSDLQFSGFNTEQTLFMVMPIANATPSGCNRFYSYTP